MQNFGIGFARLHAGNDIRHKKYYGYKKPQERYSITFRDDSENGNVEVGTLFTIR